MNTDLVKYYKDRAAEYEKIYSKPERQEELDTSAEILQKLFLNKSLLEIACGTGYWTEKIANVAKSIHATDINEAVVTIAKQKHYLNNNIVFAIEDIFNPTSTKKYSDLFAGFIWSHIHLQDLPNFIDKLASLLLPGGTIVLMDNNFVEGSNLPITDTDTFGNTYQTRKLSDGTTHLVLKNFPSEDFLKQQLSKITDTMEIISLSYFWIAIVKTK